jgi:hypothetical protein
MVLGGYACAIAEIKRIFQPPIWYRAGLTLVDVNTPNVLQSQTLRMA